MQYYTPNRILSSLSPDIVHLNSSKAGFVGRISCFFGLYLFIPYMAGVWWQQTFSASIFSFAVEFFFPFISKYICVSMPDLSIALNVRISQLLPTFIMVFLTLHLLLLIVIKYLLTA